MCALDLSSEPAYISHVLSEDDTQAVVQTSPDLSLITRYDILHRQASESAWIFFTWDSKNTKALVMKVLRPYSDTRYSLSTVTERQQCQLEAFQQNRNFTPEVYIGIARLYNQPSKEDHILIGGIIQRPVDVKFEPDAEYALIMERLPDERRLDQLLKRNKDNEDSPQQYESVLTHFLSYIHTSQSFPVVSSGENSWGSITQLRNKLIHNLEVVEQPVVADKSILQTDQFRSLFSTCKALRKTLLPIFWHPRYQNYFKERITRQQIKRCHGDLKARNIWIMPASSSFSEFSGGVNVLDAVDFNPDYCNIDTLSDFAMLIADIHARTNSQGIVNRMTTDYLNRTYQEDEASRFVLQYYLIEKAFVGAYVSILYDGSRKLGWKYLNKTKKYLEELRLLMTM